MQGKRLDQVRELDTVQPFTLEPANVSIASIELPGGGALVYSLADRAAGALLPSPDGYMIRFQARISAELRSQDGQNGRYTYALAFTTETATASDYGGQTSIERTGMRLIDGVWYAQLVAATTNKENAFPEPGAAVYAVLSGRFDRLPIGSD